MTRTWWENEDVLQRFRDWLSQIGNEIATLDRQDSDSHSRADSHDYDDEADWLDDREQHFDPPSDLQAEGESASDEYASDEYDPADEPAPQLPAVGLIPLIEAFTALRHETKLQTKSSRGLEDSVQSALHGLETAIRQFQTVQSREEEAASRAAKPFAEALAGLDEALVRGAEAVAASHRQATQAVPQQLQNSLDERFQQLSWWQRWLARGWHRHVQNACEEEISAAIAAALRRAMEGYELIQARLQRVMHEQGVTRIECLGKPVDPARMTVVELVDDSAAEPEAVLEEVRPGYTYRGKVIRFAEVRAARKLDAY